jgi:hypothetical protein
LHIKTTKYSVYTQLFIYQENQLHVSAKINSRRQAVYEKKIDFTDAWIGNPNSNNKIFQNKSNIKIVQPQE